MYDVSDMIDALENATDHLKNAEDELASIVEYEYEVKDIISIRKQLEQLLDETSEILYKQQQEEQKQLEHELDRLRI